MRVQNLMRVISQRAAKAGMEDVDAATLAAEIETGAFKLHGKVWAESLCG